MSDSELIREIARLQRERIALVNAIDTASNEAELNRLRESKERNALELASLRAVAFGRTCAAHARDNVTAFNTLVVKLGPK